MLARAICQEPRILILDEPTSYLDMRYKIDILSSIRRLAAERNMAVVMSLHELDLALKVSDVIACVEGDHIGKQGRRRRYFRVIIFRNYTVWTRSVLIRGQELCICAEIRAGRRSL